MATVGVLVGASVGENVGVSVGVAVGGGVNLERGGRGATVGASLPPSSSIQ